MKQASWQMWAGAAGLIFSVACSVAAIARSSGAGEQRLESQGERIQALDKRIDSLEGRLDRLADGQNVIAQRVAEGNALIRQHMSEMRKP